MSDRIASFEQFWPYYVGEHRSPVSRALHYLGSTFAPAVFVLGLVTGQWLLLLLSPVAGYGPAWIGHFIIEKNRPATFTYPVWSLRGDYRMLGYFLTGRMGAEVERVCGSQHPAADARRVG